MFQVFSFFVRNTKKKSSGLSAQRMTYISIHGYGKGFEHYLLYNQTGDEIFFMCIVQKYLSHISPILTLHIDGYGQIHFI